MKIAFRELLKFGLINMLILNFSLTIAYSQDHEKYEKMKKSNIEIVNNKNNISNLLLEKRTQLTKKRVILGTITALFAVPTLGMATKIYFSSSEVAKYRDSSFRKVAKLFKSVYILSNEALYDEKEISEANKSFESFYNKYFLREFRGSVLTKKQIIAHLNKVNDIYDDKYYKFFYSLDSIESVLESLFVDYGSNEITSTNNELSNKFFDYFYNFKNNTENEEIKEIENQQAPKIGHQREETINQNIIQADNTECSYAGEESIDEVNFKNEKASSSLDNLSDKSTIPKPPTLTTTSIKELNVDQLSREIESAKNNMKIVVDKTSLEQINEHLQQIYKLLGKIDIEKNSKNS